MKPRHYYKTISRTPLRCRLRCACGVVQVVDIERDYHASIIDRTITFRESAHSRRVLTKAPECTRARP